MKKLLGFLMILGTISFSKVVEKQVEIINGFYKIPAIYTYDDEKKDQPLVVMFHSTASNKDEIGGVYKELSKKLIENNNIQSIRFDFIGSGDSKVDYLQYTLTSAVSDASRVIAFARSQTKGKIGLLGWDQGATIALLEAVNQDVSTVVTWSGTTKLFNEEVKKQYEIAKSNGFVLKNIDGRTPIKISLQWFEEAKNVNVVDELSKIKVPVLAIAGKDDKLVNPIESVIIGSKTSNATSKIIYIPDANHIFNVSDKNIETPQLISLFSNTINWFVEKLK